MYRDDAVSEVVGFSLILGMVILSLGLLSVHATPQITEDLEYSQNDNVLRQFAAFKYDLDLFLAAENTGVYGRTVFTFVPEQTSFSVFSFSDLTPGRISMERGVPAFQNNGTDYYPVVFTYQSANRYAENILLELRAGTLTVDPSGLTIPAFGTEDSASSIVVTDSSFVPWVVSGVEQVIVEYRLEHVLHSDSGTLYVFDFSMR
ncbi:MAG TPA: hypothetical protein O0X72_04315 [Methanocorpusculum sp.]|nr:hypothetical protein [Methanocorpusculum sp.]